jgi:hypothetical protein
MRSPPSAKPQAPAKPEPAKAQTAVEPASSKAQPRSFPQKAAKSGGRIFASPKARRLAAEAGLDLARLVASGHPHRRAVLVLYGWSLAAGFAVVGPLYLPGRTVAALLLVLVLVVMGFTLVGLQTVGSGPAQPAGHDVEDVPSPI